METKGKTSMVPGRYKDYGAIVRKDGYKWSADLYKEGKLFMTSWMYGWKSKKALLKEIEAIGVHFGKW